MSNNPSPSKARILALSFSFTILFVIVFSLGVFVGKEFGGEEPRVTRRFDEPGPAAVTPPAEEIKEAPEAYDEVTEVESEAAPDGAADVSSPETPPEMQVESAEVAPVPSPVEAGTPATPSPEERMARITAEIERELKRAAPPEKTPPPTSVKLPPVVPDGLYTVQIGSFQDESQAQKLVGSLKSRGYPVFIKSMTTSDGKTWHRVRVGTFRDVEAADTYGKSLKILEPEVELVFITVNN